MKAPAALVRRWNVSGGEEDWPAEVPVSAAELGDGERVLPAPYDAAEHEAVRNAWWWGAGAIEQIVEVDRTDAAYLSTAI